LLSRRPTNLARKNGRAPARGHHDHDPRPFHPL
jgi:hypothetical protein